MNIEQQVDEFCEHVWEHYNVHPEQFPVEVTVNQIGSGIYALVDEEGLYFQANGEEFDIEEWFMTNNFASDILDVKQKQA